jgi:hypothetical protein
MLCSNISVYTGYNTDTYYGSNISVYTGYNTDTYYGFNVNTYSKSKAVWPDTAKVD